MNPSRFATRLAFVAVTLLAVHVTAAGTAPIAQSLPAVTVEDAIAMVRIQYSVAANQSVAAISPDGEKAAVVTWRGDLARNLNVYTLMLLDLRPSFLGKARPAVVMSRDFAGDEDDQVASPFAQVRFLADNRTLAFIGRDDNNIAQAYTVDPLSKEVRQLTRHATSVRSFVAGPDARLRAYSAVASLSTGEKQSRVEQDGVFVWDPELFPMRFSNFSALPLLWQHADSFRQYFRATAGEPALIFDSRQSRAAVPPDLDDPEVASSSPGSLQDDSTLRGWATLTGDPQGKALLLFPYGLTGHPMDLERYAFYDKPLGGSYERRIAAPYGLVDVSTGRIEPLIDAPHPQFAWESAEPLWVADGRSAIVFTLLPDAPRDPPQWVEVDLATRRTTSLRLPGEWKPVAWTDGGRALMLSCKDGRLGTLRREAGGRWGKLRERGVARGFNPDWTLATNGRLVIGVQDSSLQAPELVAYDLESKRTARLSDFNPQLRERSYGAVELLHWQSQYEKDATGFLIRPVGYQPGKRHPLVVLLDDGTLRKTGEPFLLDAAWQLSGHAIQMLAAQGVLVHMGAMADRMMSLGKAAEILYFATASHSTTRPQHRLRSLGTHIDWWRFWLKDEEDASPAKVPQYLHWRKLREKHQAAVAGSNGADRTQ